MSDLAIGPVSSLAPPLPPAPAPPAARPPEPPPAEAVALSAAGERISALLAEAADAPPPVAEARPVVAQGPGSPDGADRDAATAGVGAARRGAVPDARDGTELAAPDAPRPPTATEAGPRATAEAAEAGTVMRALLAARAEARDEEITDLVTEARAARAEAVAPARLADLLEGAPSARPAGSRAAEDGSMPAGEALLLSGLVAVRPLAGTEDASGPAEAVAPAEVQAVAVARAADSLEGASAARPTAGDGTMPAGETLPLPGPVIPRPPARVEDGGEQADNAPVAGDQIVRAGAAPPLPGPAILRPPAGTEGASGPADATVPADEVRAAQREAVARARLAELPEGVAAAPPAAGNGTAPAGEAPPLPEPAIPPPPAGTEGVGGPAVPAAPAGTGLVAPDPPRRPTTTEVAPRATAVEAEAVTRALLIARAEAVAPAPPADLPENAPAVPPAAGDGTVPAGEALPLPGPVTVRPPIPAEGASGPAATAAPAAEPAPYAGAVLLPRDTTGGVGRDAPAPTSPGNSAAALTALRNAALLAVAVPGNFVRAADPVAEDEPARERRVQPVAAAGPAPGGADEEDGDPSRRPSPGRT